MASDFQCGKCGGSISKTDEYCSSCGAKIIQHSDGLPGIIPGVTKWNFVVVAFYVFVVVPLFVISLPVLAAIAFGIDWRGLATKAARLPGIEADDGIQSGLVASVYTLALVGVGNAALSNAGDSNSQAELSGAGIEPENGSSSVGAAASPTRTSAPSTRTTPTSTPASSNNQATATQTPNSNEQATRS